jgi:hypothetical protein
MRKFLLAAAAGAALMAAAGAANAGLLWQLDVSTNYAFGTPADNNGPFGGSPDTGFVTFTNTGPSTFTGTLGDTAVPNFDTDKSLSFGGVTLAPGAHFTFAVASESSNIGGFNGPFGSSQPGIDIFFSGMFGSHSASGDIHDADVHSGVFRTNPFGISVDSWVLQGGDPLGRDTGDGFETTQASGHATFSASTRGGIPEPATWAMMLVGFFGLGAAVRARKAPVA